RKQRNHLIHVQASRVLRCQTAFLCGKAVRSSPAQRYEDASLAAWIAPLCSRTRLGANWMATIPRCVPSAKLVAALRSECPQLDELCGRLLCARVRPELRVAVDDEFPLRRVHAGQGLQDRAVRDDHEDAGAAPGLDDLSRRVDTRGRGRIAGVAADV